MKITAIKQQLKVSNRYSVFVDEAYSFSLSETALIESKLHSGQVLTGQDVTSYKKLSQDDKLYTQALRYVAMRQRTKWEVGFYLQRKGADPSLSEIILNKLSIIGLLDDQKFAESYVNDRQLLRPTSRRKIILELRKKRVPNEIIEAMMEVEAVNDTTALSAVITRMRRQTKYQDDMKLMQYLARQGFGYGDIKSALQQDLD
jgi:regulatory protein